jgi:hypothetical protein
LAHCQNLVPSLFSFPFPFVITHSVVRVADGVLVPFSKLIPQCHQVAFIHVTEFLFAFAAPLMAAFVCPSSLELVIAI